MKNVKRALALLLCLVMVLSYVPVHAHAADGNPNVTLKTSATAVNVGDTFKVTVGHGDMYVASFAFGFDFDTDLLEVTKISVKTLEFYDEENEEDSVATATEKSSKKEANESGHIGVVFARGTVTECYAKDVILEVTFTAKAAGTVVFEMFEDSSGTDGYKAEWTHGTTVTITDPNAAEPETSEPTEPSEETQPACQHANTTATPNKDGTHNVSCGDCGESVGTNVTCTYTEIREGTWKCDCGWYKEGSTLTIAEALAFAATFDHNTYTPGKYYVEGTIDSITGTMYGNMYIKDDEGNSILVYGLYSADGKTRYDAMATKPGVGDIIKVYGVLGTFSGKSQMKNAWLIEHTIPECEHVDGTDADHNCDKCDYPNVSDHSFTEEVREGTWKCACGWYKPDSILTIEEAIAFAQLAGSAFSTGKYYVTGEISEIKSTTWGNMYIADESGNKLYLYGLYSADGKTRYDAMETKPVVGDTITVYGVLGTYNGSQMKNAWMTEHIVPECKHENPTFREGTPSTCTVAGTVDSYHCEDCDRYFVDEACEVPLSDLTAPLADHDYTNPDDARKCVHFDDCGWYKPDSTLTIEEALAFAATFDHNTYTPGKYYVEGTIDSITGTKYGNMYIKDDEGNSILVFGLYSADGKTRYDAMATKPGVGDIIKVYGILGTYSGKSQMKNAWLIEHEVPHTCAPAEYEDNGDGTHKVICSCKEVLGEAEDHDYTTGDAEHTCVCGAVECYTLTLRYINDQGDYKEMGIQVAYGTKLSELAEVMALPKTIQVGNTATGDLEELIVHVGTFKLAGWAAGTTGNMVGLNDDEFQSLTMPAENYCLVAEYNFTGWYNYYGSGWQYVIDHENQGEGWIEVDGAWYYLKSATDYFGDEIFIRAEGVSRVPYPTDAINGKTYGPEVNDSDFIDATEAWFLFDEDGKFQYAKTGVVNRHYYQNGMQPWHPGVILDDEDLFYFVGDVTNGGNTRANGDTWIIKNNGYDKYIEGACYNFLNGELSDVHGIIGGKYYVKSRLMLGNGLTKFEVLNDDEYETKFIYVRSNGYVVVGAEYYVPANDLGIVPGMYQFDEYGFMVNPELTSKDGIYFENGAWYYYENGRIGLNKGLIFTDKNWFDANGEAIWGEGGIIYVRSNGQLATGNYYVTNLANYNYIVDVAAGDKLTFNDMGLFEGAKNGMVDGFYYVNNKIAYNAGVVEIEDGKYIYVRSNGEVVMDREYWITNVGKSGVVAKKYTFDENGYFTPEFAEDALNGIHNGYYYVDGNIAYGAGIVYLQDEGCYIYVKSNGQLATGIYWPTTTNGYDFSGRYDFGTDGKLYI